MTAMIARMYKRKNGPFWERYPWWGPGGSNASPTPKYSKSSEALQQYVTSMSPCPMIQDKKQKGIQWKAVSCANCSFFLLQHLWYQLTQSAIMFSWDANCGARFISSTASCTSAPCEVPAVSIGWRFLRFWVRDAKHPGIGTKTQLSRATFTPSPGGNWEIQGSHFSYDDLNASNHWTRPFLCNRCRNNSIIFKDQGKPKKYSKRRI